MVIAVVLVIGCGWRDWLWDVVGAVRFLWVLMVRLICFVVVCFLWDLGVVADFVALACWRCMGNVGLGVGGNGLGVVMGVVSGVCGEL